MSDPAAYLDLAFDPVRGNVGIAYFVGTPVPGSYTLKYVQWKDGVATAPETVDQVQRAIGLSLDFDPTTGQPAIAYLGGGSDGSLFWFQSDAEVAFRAANGTWSRQAVVTNGFTVTCNDTVSDNVASTVVGVWSAAKFDASGNLWVCYRDVHSGQNTQDSWAKSDVECLRGRPGSWPLRECVYAGGMNGQAASGGHLQLVMAGGEPVLSWDSMLGGADTRGTGGSVWRRNAGTWTGIGNFGWGDTQSGAALSWDAQAGLGYAVHDLTRGTLFFRGLGPTATQWSEDPVFGDGSGGWWPSIAYDGEHEPSIAFFVCSGRPMQNESQCDVHELRVTRNTLGNWSEQLVDAAGGKSIRVRTLANGKRVIAYRDLQSGAVKLAAER